MNLRKIFLIEGILIIGIFIVLLFLSAPRQIYPFHGMAISENDFNFEIENAKDILISIDENFTNPIILGIGEQITLPPGIYFWKVRGNLRESEIRNFTIQSNAALELKEKNKTYEIINSGNIDLNVSKNNSLTFVISRGESKEFEKDNSTYIGGQT